MDADLLRAAAARLRLLNPACGEKLQGLRGEAVREGSGGGEGHNWHAAQWTVEEARFEVSDDVFQETSTEFAPCPKCGIEVVDGHADIPGFLPYEAQSEAVHTDTLCAVRQELAASELKAAKLAEDLDQLQIRLGMWERACPVDLLGVLAQIDALVPESDPAYGPEALDARRDEYVRLMYAAADGCAALVRGMATAHAELEQTLKKMGALK